jgi:transposase
VLNIQIRRKTPTCAQTMKAASASTNPSSAYSWTSLPLTSIPRILGTVSRLVGLCVELGTQDGGREDGVALGLYGFIDYDLYHGDYNKERFLSFIKRLLVTKMNAYGPGVPRSDLIMDNAPIHSGAELATLCKQHGVRLKFLPPYCPHLNPIEEIFHELKASLKRYRELAAEYAALGWCEVFIVMGIEGVIKRDSAWGNFQPLTELRPRLRTTTDDACIKRK